MESAEIKELLQRIIPMVAPDKLYEKEIFRALIPISDAIAKTFGKYCEVVIHDLRQPDSSLIHVSGNVTQRSIGAPVTNLVLKKLRKYGNKCEDMIGYKSKTKEGHILKSSTIFIRNSGGEIIGSMCVNYDITALLNNIEQFMTLDNSFGEDENEEFFAKDVTEILDTLISQAVSSGGVTIECMDKEDKIKLVRDLDIKGVFLIKGAVDKVALVLGVSRYTIYNYLEQERAKSQVT